MFDLKAGEAAGNVMKVFKAMVKIGYPGECPMPSVYAAAAVSGESSFLKAGKMQYRYVQKIKSAHTASMARFKLSFSIYVQ
jgi:hypothetical protein